MPFRVLSQEQDLALPMVDLWVQCLVALAAVSGMICLLNGAHIVRRLCPVIKPRYDVAQICR